jgi:hypothetical protein
MIATNVPTVHFAQVPISAGKVERWAKIAQRALFGGQVRQAGELTLGVSLGKLVVCLSISNPSASPTRRGPQPASNA